MVNPDTEPRLLILGAGPTGLGAAYRLLEKGYRNWKIVERHPWIGGLSTSFRDDKGFTWDVGGHVVFSHYEDFDRFFADMTGGEIFTHDRKSFIRIAQRFVPYPFQNNIRYLPPDMLERCLLGLEEAAAHQGEPDRANFLAWNLSRLGEGITRLFIEPDNIKRWALPLDQLSAEWVGERVSPVDVERIKENIRLGRDDVSWGPNNRFQFPKRGGTGAIFEPMTQRIGDRLNLNREAIEIDPVKRQVRFSDGGVEAYDRLLSTIPIDRLVAMTKGAPGSVTEAASRLKHADGYIVGLGLEQPVPGDKCWIYCPEKPAPFFRATYFSNYSPHNAPDQKHYSFMCDISHSSHLPRNKETIVEETLCGLIETGLLQESDRDALVATYLIDEPYTYPIPTLDRDPILREVHPWLEAQGLHSRGRFGTWLYEIGNMDHCTVMGMQWAEAVLDGKPESVWEKRG
ncbi:FAD-dependent oxidoreductase [bacterium]|nr:FAD-dependent oxidoreductase [bacterium]